MIAYSIKPLLQITLSLAAAVAVGYRPEIFFGTYYSPGYKILGCFMVLIIMIIFTFSSVGLGMITAALVKTSNAAAGLSFAFIVPQQIFGTFIPPFILGMDPVGWALPSYYPARLFFLIFVGAPFDTWPTEWTFGWPNPTQEIWFRFGILVAFSVVVFALGVFIYNRKKRGQ
jgi:ABC-type transport system involved in multi-copper enzyme maturation permease subunit